MGDDDDNNAINRSDRIEARLAIVAAVVLNGNHNIVKDPAGPIETQTMLGDIHRILVVIPFEENCSHKCIYRQ